MQFLNVTTGGPAIYEGRDMREAHANLHVVNAEFDAEMSDLKATLDKLGVPTDEQKELLAIVESTRPMISETRRRVEKVRTNVEDAPQSLRSRERAREF